MIRLKSGLPFFILGIIFIMCSVCSLGWGGNGGDDSSNNNTDTWNWNPSDSGSDQTDWGDWDTDSDGADSGSWWASPPRRTCRSSPKP